MLAQVLGQEGIGLFALLRALPAVLLMLTELGIASASPYLINKRKFDAKSVLGNAILAGLIIGLAQLLLWSVSYRLIGEYILQGLPIVWVLAAGLLAPVEVQLMELQGIFRAMQQFWAANFMRIGTEAAILATLSLAAAFDALALSSLVPCLLLAQLLVLLIGAGRLAVIGLFPAWRIDVRLLGESVRYGIRAQLGAAIQYLNYRLDHLILGVLTNPEVVGLYFIASRAAELFRFLPASVWFVLSPRLAGRSFQSAARAVWRYALPLFLINLAVMIFAAVVGPYVFPILFDDWSLEAIVPFWILLVGLAAMGANGVFSSFHDSQGMPELNAYSSAMGLGVTIVLDLALIPLYGQIGAAIASSLAYGVVGIMLAGLFWRTTRTGGESSARA